MQNKIPCSVGMLTFNSERTLRRALESVRDFAEIIICDGGSEDGTLKIAEEYGCKIIFQDEKFKNPDNTINDFSGVRNRCMDAASYDWFFYIDSDEECSRGLAEEIAGIAGSGAKTLVYEIPSRFVIGSKVIKYSSSYPGYQRRFFNKKSGARFIKEVHEKIKYDTAKFKTQKLKHPWYIHWEKDRVDNYFKYAGKYINIEMERNKNQPFSSWLKYGFFKNIRTIAVIFLKSLKNYALHGRKDTMPMKVEAARIMYAAKLMYFLALNQLKKIYV